MAEVKILLACIWDVPILNAMEPHFIVFPHVLSALFGPEISPLSITLFFPASIVPRTVVFLHKSLKNHGPSATFSHIDSFF
jgi:hypothetical protein